MKQFSITMLVFFAFMIGLSGLSADTSSSKVTREDSNSKTIVGLSDDKKPGPDVINTKAPKQLQTPEETEQIKINPTSKTIAVEDSEKVNELPQKTEKVKDEPDSSILHSDKPVKTEKEFVRKSVAIDSVSNVKNPKPVIITHSEVVTQEQTGEKEEQSEAWTNQTKPLLLAQAGKSSTSGEPETETEKNDDKKPNIVIIWGDDIGQSNISAYTMGMMGYRTPNIDRVAREGMIFTDYYAEQSCTAGRAAFITGQSVFRTGLSKVGLPGADHGLRKEDPTIAELLKPLGYATGQFGKNHLGDKNEMLPSNHGFDEFYGNLYHLNAEEEPELPDYPKDPEFRKKYGPRGVIHSFADGRIEDTGPLTKKRMETIDDDVAARSVTFIEEQHKAGNPFFVWVNFTHMHFRTHTKPESLGQSGRWQSPYHDTMIDHDKNVGQVLDKLDELGISENTIVMYGTDNGPHMNSWPDAAMTPFRNEKNSNWEGAYRVPAMVRWPGKIKPGTVSNEIMSHMDWLPTLVAAAGDADIKEKLLKGHNAGNKTFKVHLDGYNFLPYLTGKEQKGPREEFIYFSDDGGLTGLRYDNWKVVFSEQRQRGTLQIWFEPFTHLRAPKLFNLRMDPYERADVTSNTYWDWLIDHVFLFVPAQDIVGEFLQTFREFPPRQKAASFTIDQVMEKLAPQSH